ncbi:hypothetical protein BVY05_08595 [Pectobacterium odoriferum]|nr:hypothetical protein BVY05_08595 [Pectobacterium odoriferum]POE39807.1 hypothetical protein BV920_10415 [Pectobacterium odoriferum]
MRWLPLLTPVTYCCKLLGIRAVAAFTQLELFRAYFENTRDFRNAIFSFFSTTLPEIADSLTSRIHDRFQVLKPAS